jgi:SagB-type dehydrogenase family enzyme
MAAALDQACVGAAAAHVVLAAVYERTTGRYGQRGRRYVHMDAGHAGQNVCLQAEALHLGTVVVGAFDDRRVRAVLGLPEGQEPLSIMPIGRR